MQGIFLTLYDFPAGLALAIFVGFNLFVVFIVNVFIVLIEGFVLRKMRYGTRLASFGVASLMNLVSALAGYITGYMIYILSGVDNFVSLLAYYPTAMINNAVGPRSKIDVLQVFIFLCLCYGLTVTLELMVLFIFRKTHSSRQIGKMVMVANLFSYLFLFAVYGVARVYFSSGTR